MKVSINCNIENGKISTNRKVLERSIKEFDCKRVTITIEKAKKKRSNGQNAYYFGVVVPMIKNALNESYGEKFGTQEIHEFLKQKFNGVEVVNEETGEVLIIAKSTTENTTSDFMDYLAEIKTFGEEFLNIDIPEPNEQLTLEV